MPERAVEELGKIEDAGPLEGPVQLLHGIALKQTNNNRDAIPHLERAARIMPSPIRRFAWRELVDAYRAVGSNDLAEMALKLSGDGDIQLKIALPFAQMTLNIPVSPKTT
jgi:predicted Zn-dependent protease